MNHQIGSPIDVKMIMQEALCNGGNGTKEDHQPYPRVLANDATLSTSCLDPTTPNKKVYNHIPNYCAICCVQYRPRNFSAKVGPEMKLEADTYRRRLRRYHFCIA